MFASPLVDHTPSHLDILPLSTTDARGLDPRHVGGKGAGLIRLVVAGLPVPPGFVLSATMYRQWREHPDGLASHHEAIIEHARALGGLVSVRSSASTEDLGGGACAGQHETFLGLRPEQVPEAIAKCYASLTSSRATRYRDRMGIDEDATEMAVVVQRMVPAASAGVAFTVDPVSGDPNVLVVESAFGLGESVVAGVEATDTWRLNRRSLDIEAHTEGAQGTRLLCGDDGVESHPAPSGPSLTEDQVRGVAALARAVEAGAGVPQDVEWALDETGELFLLQARPVTALPPRWTRDESAERFPGVMSPLGWDFSEGGFHTSLKASLELMGLPAFDGKWFGRFGHFIYGNETAVKLYLTDRAEGTELDPFASIHAFGERFGQWRARHAWMPRLLTQWDSHLSTFIFQLGRLDAQAAPETVAEAWQRLLDLEAIGTRYFLPNIAISIGHGITWRALHRALTLFCGEEEAHALAAALTADDTIATKTVQRDLAQFAATIVRCGVDPSTLAGDDLAARWDALLDTDEVISEAAASFLERHGHCTLDPDAMIPCWAAAPGQLLGLLESMLAARGAAPARDAAEARFAAESTVRDIAGEHASAVLHLAALARGFQRLDDVEHYQTTRLHAAFRPLALNLGDHLVKAGALDCAGDVFFAHKATLEDLISGESSARQGGLAAEVAENKRGMAEARQHEAPWSLDEEDNTSIALDAEGTLRGQPGAAGTVTAPVCIIEGPEDFHRFVPGSILVARTTHPTWTPLFYSAAGVITESGGPLSHGAVTARELGLPAVMGVRGVMTELVDGQQVTLNGGEGWVTDA
ncbi:MAG: PEP/pyruvate-binding domain-containing protein [Bradymonadia bacterium]